MLAVRIVNICICAIGQSLNLSEEEQQQEHCPHFFFLLRRRCVCVRALVFMSLFYLVLLYYSLLYIDLYLFRETTSIILIFIRCIFFYISNFNLCRMKYFSCCCWLFTTLTDTHTYTFLFHFINTIINRSNNIERERETWFLINFFFCECFIVLSIHILIRLNITIYIVL